MNDVHCQCTSNRVPKNYIRVKSWWYLQKDTCTLQYLQSHAKMQLIWKASHEICPMSRTIHFTKGASYNDHAMHCNEMKPPFCVFKDHSVTQKLYLKWPHSYEAKILYMVLNVNFHLHKAKYIPFYNNFHYKTNHHICYYSTQSINALPTGQYPFCYYTPRWQKI